jgi:integrase
VNFTAIVQPWLREAMKRWGAAAARDRLLVQHGHDRGDRDPPVLDLSRRMEPPVLAPELIDQPLIERYLAWVAAQPLADATKNSSRVFVRGFLNDNRRHRWLPTIPADALIHLDELSSHKRPLPRFIPEFVMAQLESPAALAQLRPHHRHLIVLISETGLRAGDACALPFNTLITDSTGWPCLRLWISKMRAEHLLPLSARAAEACGLSRQMSSAISRTAQSGCSPHRSTGGCRSPTAVCGRCLAPGRSASACTTSRASPCT